jgi:hypothetical protein
MAFDWRPVGSIHKSTETQSTMAATGLDMCVWKFGFETKKFANSD